MPQSKVLFLLFRRPVRRIEKRAAVIIGFISQSALHDKCRN